MQPFYSKIQGNVWKSCRKSLPIRSLSGRQSLQVYNLLLMGFSVSFCSFSSWGKFGERQNKPKTHVIQSAHQLYSILSDPSYHISAIRICSEDVMEVVTTRDDEEVERSLKTNLCIVIFTPAHARYSKHYNSECCIMSRIRSYINGAQGR